MSRRRTPTPEEFDLWQRATRGVMPLRGRPRRSTADKHKAEEKSPTASPHTPRWRCASDPPGPLDAKLTRRLGRGALAIDARLDLHGTRQIEAHRRLATFVHECRATGCRTILVITGKGSAGEGVLRRLVPQWLAEEPLRSHVAGLATAHRRHGGEGALYVRLRRGNRR